MLNITKTAEGSALTIALEGRLDTTTAPDLEGVWKEASDGITELTIDLKTLDYISSAGLRVLLSMQKTMNKQGKMRVTNVSSDVMEVFEVTGFSDILTIE
jgi:anti-sigma B factor antagonist